MKVDVYLGVFQFKITVNIDRHDYKDEFLKSIVQGRQGERLRLARKKDLEINNGKRKYIPGSNESIDRLLDSASEFANDYLDMQGLNFLACLSNYDSQPSNYFTSGKLNDLDKICNGSSIYMAARLLGHPDVVDFLGNLSAEKKSEYFNKAIDEIDMPEIKDAAKFMNENPDLVRDDDYLFGMYCAKKLQDCQKNPIKRTVNKMYTSFKAHKAWISMYHVMTHQCRHKDTEMAKRYVRNTLSFLDTPEFSDMKCAYVDAIANSRHKHLLE